MSEPQHIPNYLRRQWVLSLPVDIQTAKEHFSPHLVITLASTYGKIQGQSTYFQCSLLKAQWKAGKFEQSVEEALFV